MDLSDNLIVKKKTNGGIALVEKMFAVNRRDDTYANNIQWMLNK